MADNRRVAGDEKDEDRDGQEEEEEEEGHYYHGDFGLFIPRWANERVSGWLGGEDATLAGLGLRSGDVVECRPRRHRLTLLLPYTSSSSSSSSLTSSASAISAAEAQQPRLLRVTTPTALTIARLLPRLLRAVTADGKSVPVMEPSLSAVVGLLDRDAELLHLPLPHEKVMYLLATNGSAGASEGRVDADSCSLYIWLPSKEGILWKYGERTSRFGKRWQKRYFVLMKDKLFYYKSASHKARGEALSFIGIQRVRGIVNTEPFDSFSRKGPDCCFQIETSTGEVHHLIAENKQQQAEWTEQLMAWLELKLFFGPDKRSSVQLFRKLSAEREGRCGTGRPSPSTSPTPSSPLQKTVSPSKTHERKAEEPSCKLPAKMDDDEAESETEEDRRMPPDEALEPPPHEGVGQPPSMVQINLLLQDGSVQPLIVDPDVEIYDLVYAVAHEIGSRNAFQITSLDQDPSRRVELLDHQRSLRQHQLPKSAMFVLKKTGIIDDHIGEDDIFDNHFLYAMLPEAEGYLLKHVTGPPPLSKKRDTAGLFSARRRWRKQFFAIKANNLFFFPSHHDLSPLGFIPLGSIAAVGRIPAPTTSSSSSAPSSSERAEEERALHECAIRIRVAGPTDDATAAVVVHLLADTPADADRWIRLLRSWRQFFALESFADDRPTGLDVDVDNDNGEGGGNGIVGVDPLSFVQAGPRLLAARAARAAAGLEASAPKSEDADKFDEGEKESEKKEMKRTKTKREEEEAEATEHQPGGAQRPPPPRLKPLSWRSSAATSVVEGGAAVTSPRGSPRVGGGAEGGGGLGSSQSETRAGRESPRSGASGWLSPRRLAEALSFRSLSPGGSGSNLRRAESARTERD